MTDYIHSNNQPMRELSGSLSDYKKNITLSFEEIREQAWQENTVRFFTKKILLHCSKKVQCHPRVGGDPGKLLQY